MEKILFPLNLRQKYCPHIMKNLFASLCILLLSVSALAQQGGLRPYSGRVVDEVTGEPLPFVNVYAGEGRGAVTNLQGDFTLSAHEDDVLRFSFVGYATQTVVARRLPAVMKLRELAVGLSGVEVLGDDALLMKVVKTMSREYRKNLRHRTPYFNRISVRYGNTMEMVETFIDAASAVNLRTCKLTSGKYWARNLVSGGEGRKRSSLTRTNLHWLMSLGPMMRDSQFWDGITIPLPHDATSSYFSRHYEVSRENITDDDGRLIYRFHFKPKRLNERIVLGGTLYVDAATYRPLRFDGSLRSVMLNVKHTDDQSVMSYENISIFIDYTHHNGFSEVNTMEFELETDELDMHCTLVNVDAFNLPLTFGETIGDNLLYTIRNVGANVELDKEFSFMKRTEDEDLLVSGDNEVDLQQMYLGDGLVRDLVEAVKADKALSSDSLSLSPEARSVMAYIRHAMRFNIVQPQEKVYLHLDNTGYFKGETIRFKAYLTRTDTERSTDLSRVLYVELLNPGGDVVATRKLSVNNGVAWGDISIDSIMQTGFYELRAYTRYMMNWGSNVCFSRVIPVFNAPSKEGDYSTPKMDMLSHRNRLPDNRSDSDLGPSTFDPDAPTSESKFKRSSSRNVHFYPEGGSMVADIEGRVAFTVTYDDGMPAVGAVCEVKDATGSIICSATADTDGRGLFRLTPSAGTAYTMTARCGGKEWREKLPQPLSDGCSLNVDMSGNDDFIDVSLRTSQGLQGRMLGYVIMHGGQILQCDTLTASEHFHMSFLRSRSPAGVNQLTVFDANGKICAERLFFVCPQLSLLDSVRVAAGTEMIQPCGRVELTISAEPRSQLSFSAVDAATMVNGRVGDIRTWLLLGSEIKGYIAHPEYYFEADDAEHRRRADLLMMVQGWRRYDWRLMTGQIVPERQQHVEDRLYLTGRLYPRKSQQYGGVDISATLYNVQGQSLKGQEKSDSLGNYHFGLPDITGKWNLLLRTSVAGEPENYSIGIDRNFSPKSRLLSPAECAVQPTDTTRIWHWQADDSVTVVVGKRDQLLPEVKVKARRNWKDTNGWTNERYARYNSNIFYDCDADVDSYLDAGRDVPSFGEWLKEKNEFFYGNPQLTDLIIVMGDDIRMPDGSTLPTSDRAGNRMAVYYDDFDPQRGLNYDVSPLSSQMLLYTGGLTYKNRPIVWIVDNMFVTVTGCKFYSDATGDERLLSYDENPRYIRTMKMMISYDDHSNSMLELPDLLEDVNTVYISEDKEAMHKHIQCDKIDRMDPVTLYVFTHREVRATKQKGVRRTTYQGFNTPSVFKMEDYSVMPPVEDFRRTIYWKPNVITNQKGKAHIEFYNNSSCTDMYISIEGLDSKGRPLTK